MCIRDRIPDLEKKLAAVSAAIEGGGDASSPQGGRSAPTAGTATRASQPRSVTEASPLPFVGFDPKVPVGFLRGGNLPHWRQDGTTYFVTWRTADSLPKARVDAWFAERDEWMKKNPEPWTPKMEEEFYQRFPDRWEKWLDDCKGECLLAQQELRKIVESTLRHDDGMKYHLRDFVVAPNHVHVLVTPTGGENTLSEAVQVWKSVSSHRINQTLGRKGEFWQKEYFDHIVRSPEQLAKFKNYIQNHPQGGGDASSPKSGGDAPVAGGFEKGDEGVTSTLRAGPSRPRLLRQEVTDEDIARVVASWTHIPVARMLEGEREKLLHMEARLQRRIIGQQPAIAAVANAVRRARSGLQDPNRPIGSFIFLGPTGVGKTETARALAEFLFDDENAMVRIDMSEYMEKHTVARLIGAPPGYVGYEAGGQLSEAVRRKPYAVILFDEIEKAHSDVFNVLLQVLDDGRLTDGKGRTVDFKNTIVIMTSNLGSPIIQDYFLDGKTDKASHQAMEDKVLAELKRHFRPEFLNRVDDTIIFQSLDESELTRIVDIQLRRLEQRLAQQNLTLELDAAAKKLLATEGYDPQFGARPLKRAVQEHLLNPLSMKILEGEFKPGDKIQVTADGDELKFQRK